MSKTEKKNTSNQEIQEKLTLFFPGDAHAYTYQTINDGIECDDIMVKPEKILPYLQTALIDEKILEVEFDDLSQVYFSKVFDDPPSLEGVEGDEDPSMEVDEYNFGDYLKSMTHLITLPLEPGMGNMHIRNSKKIIIRIFTSSYAIELGTYFQDMALVQNIPVLRLDFPVIARLVRGARVFRAKVPDDMSFTVLIVGKRKGPNMKTRPIDISAQGMAFKIKKKDKERFIVDETCTLQFIISGTIVVKVNCIIRHVSKVRGQRGVEYRCGVQFDIDTRSTADVIENIVAKVQRAHLQELFNKSLDIGIDLVH